MRAHRAYKRLIISILEDSPLVIQRLFLAEYEKEIDEHVTFGEILSDAKSYVVHYQSGRAILINRNAPLTRKIINDGELAQEQKEDRILRRKLQNKQLTDEEKREQYKAPQNP